MPSHQTVVEELTRRFKPEAAANLNITYLINVRGAGAYLTKINNGQVDFSQVDENEAQTNGRSLADCCISIDREDLEEIIKGKMSAMTAALQGLLNVQGDITMAMKLVPIFFS